MTLELTTVEMQLIAELIQSALTELPTEVRRTQTSAYRDDLKTRELHLRELQKKFGENA